MENFNNVPSTGKYGDSIAVVNENFMLAQQEMEMLRQIYNSMSQSQPIPVITLPATGEAGKIYRLAGANSYADYMYAESDLTTPIKMAEYDNAIDDEPTAGSNNLVKSGGVDKTINNLGLTGTEPVQDIPLDTYSITNNGVFGTNDSYKHAVLPVVEGEVYYITPSASSRAVYATSNECSAGGSIPFVNGTSAISMAVGELYKFVIPSGCNYLLFSASSPYSPYCYKQIKPIEHCNKEVFKRIKENHKLLWSKAPSGATRTLSNNLYGVTSIIVVIEANSDCPNVTIGVATGTSASTITQYCVNRGTIIKGYNIFTIPYNDENVLFIGTANAAIDYMYVFEGVSTIQQENCKDIQYIGNNVGIYKKSNSVNYAQGEKIDYTTLGIDIDFTGKFSVKLTDINNAYESFSLWARNKDTQELTLIAGGANKFIGKYASYVVDFEIDKLYIGTSNSVVAATDTTVYFEVAVEGVKLAEKADKDSLLYGQTSELQPTSIIQGKYVGSSGQLVTSEIFDVYCFQIPEGKKVAIQGRMNGGNQGKALITFSEEVDCVGFISRPLEYVSPDNNFFYVPTREKRDMGCPYEVLDIPEGAHYLNVNVRNTPSTISQTHVLSCDKDITFDALNYFLTKTNSDNNSIGALYNNNEHKRKICALTKKPVNGRGNEATHVDTTKPMPLSIVQFSDSHGSNNVKRVLDYCTIYNSQIDEIINCGDTARDYFTDGIDFYTNIEGTERILSVIGNHDTRATGYDTEDLDQWSYYAGLEAYNVYIKPFVNNWGVVQPLDAETAGKCYYYKDYTNCGIRLVVVDNMVTAPNRPHYDSSQLEWFDSVIQDALANSLTVVCVSHFPNHDTVIDSPFGNYTQEAHSGDWANSTFVNFFKVIDDFKKANGKFVCWLCGHKHSSVLGYATNYDDQLIVSVGSTIEDARSGWARITETPSQDFFHHLAIDTNTNVLKIAQIGVDYDRYMRNRNVLCYNYQTNEFL